MARDEYGLSPRQRAWCDEYIRTGNGQEAARKAGYKLPKKSSEDNRDNRACQAYIAERMQPTVDKRIADADEVLLYLSAVMRGELKDQFGLEISIQDRTKAAQELLKRYAVADMRQQSTMQRLDAIFAQLRIAVSAPAPAPVAEGVMLDDAGDSEGDVSGPDADGGSPDSGE